jgi:hypothetical protein
MELCAVTYGRMVKMYGRNGINVRYFGYYQLVLMLAITLFELVIGWCMEDCYFGHLARSLSILSPSVFPSSPRPAQPQDRAM